MIQARDEKGNYLYRLSIEEKINGLVMVSRSFLKRKKPIKQFDRVLNNELKKRGKGFYFINGIESACLETYKQWDHERNNPQ